MFPLFGFAIFAIFMNILFVIHKINFIFYFVKYKIKNIVEQMKIVVIIHIHSLETIKDFLISHDLAISLQIVVDFPM